ncbi:protein O-linked-mannose beta-1,2-N-acetylglucosaminyltransferase 1-like [Penaeus japonicus]|uniref:protein O-linked-mannose beta-1,2-N-acetylglucosaminyltransferase 1-like n=1 Tax=Penaeus japonicus TaxID=27405 RepID=UPI001C71464A|nr:protein O-linked-mannose beta-1,2-N-acetylglucosaminyltransferase 1-like [Penaeus japonicus]
METRFVTATCLVTLLALLMPQTSARWLEASRVTLASWSSSRGAALHTYAHNYTHADLAARMDYSRRQIHVPIHGLRDEDLTLLVLNQRSGRAITQRSFRTSEEFSWWADLSWWLQRVSPGRLVVITVTGRATLGLRHARTLFTDLGSTFASYLAQQTTWTWAFVKGGRTIYESILKGSRKTEITFAFDDINDSVYAEGNIDLSTEPLPTIIDNTDKERWQYCQLHGAMGGLCDEHSPDPLPPPSPPTLAHQSALANVPVVVTAGARHQYLYHTLNTLLAAPGAQRSNVLVVLGDAPQPTTQLLRLINVNFTQVPVHGKDNFKLFRYYRSVFQLVARTFPDAPAVIFLDEDVEVSPDFFSFMSQTLWLLREDPTLYCINSYSYLLTSDNGRRANYVRRGETQVMWGYAVTIKFIKESLRMWPESGENEDILTYDYWLYEYASKGRECIYPDVSRSRHYGLGINTNPLQHEYDAWRRPLLKASDIVLYNTHELLNPGFERNLLLKLKTARVLGKADPCGPRFPPLSTTFGPFYVMFFAMEHKEDIRSWNLLGPCAGLPYTSEQSHHAGVFWAVYHPTPQSQGSFDNTHGLNYFTPRGKDSLTHNQQITVYFIGVPYSKYSFLKPEKAFLFNGTAMNEQEISYFKAKQLQPLEILMINTTFYTYEKLLSSFFV